MKTPKILFFKSILVSLLSLSCSHHTKTIQHDCLMRRAAIDLGSGSTKLKVYDVDTCKKQIIKEVRPKDCSKTTRVAYKDGLIEEKFISQTNIKEGQKVLSELYSLAKKCGAKQISAVATSVFRQAKNAKSAINQLNIESKIPINIISQKEEARLGYLGAIAHKGNPNNICVWDIGGSSVQITCLDEKGKLYQYLGHLAAVPFKDHILKLQKSRSDSPNPITNSNLEDSLHLLEKEAKSVFKFIPAKFFKNKTAIGIGGVHYYAIAKALDKTTYSSTFLYQELTKRLNKSDSQLEGGDYVSTSVSNIILVYGMMKTLQISSVEAINIDLSEGLAVSLKYWN